MKTLYSLLSLACALVLVPAAKADSITFESYSAVNHSYTYDITFDEHTAIVIGGFALTGLSGVTDAILTGQLANDFVVANTSTSVGVGTLATLEAGFRVPFSVGTLTVYSLSLPGTVSYALLDNHGFFTGTVEGPATSAVPEPSTLLMLGTGLLGIAGGLHRKFVS